MGKILMGIVLLGGIWGVVSVSAKQDESRQLSYDKCLRTFTSERMPLESREGFLADCMQ